ncbi:MAG TPA: nucleotide sugar dehydrogenase [Solirubrobacteraceae bacterium]
MRAVVVALGKIGLPLAAQIARAGHDVVGCDIDPAVVDAVNAGEPPFPGEAGLAEALRETVAAGRLKASTRTTDAVAAGPDLVVAVPPLAVDRRSRPGWRALDAAVRAIGAGLQPGTTVSVETTVPLGTTRSRLAPLLEQASGLIAERHFHIVFSPERVYSGRVFRDLATYPKLVGGLSADGEARAVELYRSFLDAEVWPMGSAETAELAKLAETTYRDLNIAFANELARIADDHGVDVARAIEGANSQPFSHIHQPGVAVGGHCIPVYPRFLLAGAPDARLPRAAREVNEAMPGYAVDLLGDVAGWRVLVLGVTYRGGVKETAFSGALALRDELQARRVSEVLGHDPLLSEAELEALDFLPWHGEPVDAAIVQADHAEYADLGPEDLPAEAIVDGRGVLDAERFGGRVKRLGRP